MQTRKHTLVYCLLIAFAIMAQIAFAQEAEPEQEMVVCPKCSTKNLPDAKFCVKCGTPLKSAKPTEPEEALLPVNEVQPVKKEIERPLVETKMPIVQPLITDSLRKKVETMSFENIPQAKALYTYGLVLFEKGSYNLAQIRFKEIIELYPNTSYAEAAILMQKACYQLDVLQKAEDSKKKPTSSVFGASFVGSMLGVASSFLLLLLLIAAGD